MTKPRIGIIGAGRLGTVLARQVMKAGYQVAIANSRGPASLDLMLSVLLPGATAASVEDVIQRSDIIILAIPLSQYVNLPKATLAGKTIIDAMNYWPPTEGVIAEFDDATMTSSEYLQSYFKDAVVVKTLNHVAYHELEAHSLPAGHAERRAVVVVADNQAGKQQVTELVDAIGFDAVDFGELAKGKAIQPDTHLFNARYTATEIARHK